MTSKKNEKSQVTYKSNYTTGEVARLCGVNFRTVIRWIEKGALKSYKLPGRGDNRIQKSELLRFMQEYNMPIPETLQEEKASRPPHILIVEDEENIAKAIARTLKRNGYTTALANDGFQVGTLLVSESPDLMTLDLRMPSVDGIQVLKYIKDNNINIPTLVISAGNSKELNDAIKLGAKDIIEKPFKNSELIAKIKALLEN